MMTFRPGWRPDPAKEPGQTPDFDAAAKLRAGPLPVAADNRDLIVEVLDQGGLGSCVAHAVMQAVRASQVRNGAVNPPLGSRLWTYYLARAMSNETQEDNGTFLRNAFAAIVKLGFPSESEMPYVDDGRAFRLPPPPNAFRMAHDQRQPTSYHRIFETGAARVASVKRALSQGFLVTLGTLVSDRFCSNDLGSGPIPPPIGETIVGGHALCVVGYDGDDFDVVNSWSASWGAGGYFTMSADWLAWGETRDLWLVESAPPFSDVA